MMGFTHACRVPNAAALGLMAGRHLLFSASASASASTPITRAHSRAALPTFFCRAYTAQPSGTPLAPLAELERVGALQREVGATALKDAKRRAIGLYPELRDLLEL